MDAIWTEIIVKTQVSVLERAEAALHMATPLGLYIEDYSDLESAVRVISGIDLIDGELINKDRDEALLHVYFEPGLNRTECVAVVRETLNRAGFTEKSSADAFLNGAEAEYIVVSADGIEEEDWANNWKHYFKPLRVGKGILIMPEWETQVQRGDLLFADVKAIIRIDPGMAFGTGGHATTRLCLELLEMCFESNKNYNPDGYHPSADKERQAADVLDLGCGSGILAIASVLLGAHIALGVDIDRYAVRNAAENAARNGVTERTRFASGNLFAGIDGRFDIILANIVADVVIKLLPDAGNRLQPGGALILSGIIADREADVTTEAAAHNFRVEETRREEGWTAFLLRQINI